MSYRLTELSRCALLSSGGLAFLVVLMGLSEPDGQAAPVPVKRQGAAPVWPKTTPADRARSVNNLKQIALAMHNYHDVFNGFPASALCNNQGKPMLSWRVALLPYLEEFPLYKQFKLDEPWDSANNKKLLSRIPAIYRLPGVKVTPEHGTFYRVFTGADTPFKPVLLGPGAGPIGLKLAQFTDGTSNTILVAEAGEAVPWTKPDEIVYHAKKPVPRLGGLFPEGFHIAFADGSVKFIGRKISETALRALITPAGGEVIDWKTIPLAKPPAEKK
jgi:hypothetical protein